MARINEIWDALRAEMSLNIRSIELERAVDPRCRFVEFEADDDNQDIRMSSVGTRQFQIMPPVNVGDARIGNNTSHPTFDVEIVFAYPQSPKWEAAALEDTGQIQWYFRTHPSAVSGVSLRFPKADAVITQEKSGEDLRRFYTLTLAVQAEVDFTS